MTMTTAQAGVLDLENLWENEFSRSSSLVGEQLEFAHARTIIRATHSWRIQASP